MSPRDWLFPILEAFSNRVSSDINERDFSVLCNVNMWDIWNICYLSEPVFPKQPMHNVINHAWVKDPLEVQGQSIYFRIPI